MWFRGNLVLEHGNSKKSNENLLKFIKIGTIDRQKIFLYAK
jgi:hypothetical protein